MSDIPSQGYVLVVASPRMQGTHPAGPKHPVNPLPEGLGVARAAGWRSGECPACYVQDAAWRRERA
eukprot:14858807-Alexandrium_andersonii.AAC.1